MVNSDVTAIAPPPGMARRQVFFVINPIAGRSNPAALRAIIAQALGEAGVPYTLHAIAEGEDVTATVRAAVAAGHTDVVAAGGDGTIAAVASAIVAGEARLGILPIGTANVLARELRIPLDPLQATALIVAPHQVIMLDAMRLGKHISLLQVDIGLNSVMIRDTQTWAKRLVGRAAYLWTAFTRLVGYEPRRFRVVVDGLTHSVPGMQVVVANAGLLGMEPFRWGPDIDPSDGRVDVALLRARTMRDMLRMAWDLLLGRQRGSPHIDYLRAERSVYVAADPPLPVQADGEIIGDTPCAIEVIRAAVRVIVPLEHTPPAADPSFG